MEEVKEMEEKNKKKKKKEKEAKLMVLKKTLPAESTYGSTSVTSLSDFDLRL